MFACESFAWGQAVQVSISSLSLCEVCILDAGRQKATHFHGVSCGTASAPTPSNLGAFRPPKHVGRFVPGQLGVGCKCHV